MVRKAVSSTTLPPPQRTNQTWLLTCGASFTPDNQRLGDQLRIRCVFQVSDVNRDGPTGREPKQFLSANSLTYCPGSDTFLCQQKISENSSNERWHLFSFVEGSVSLKLVAKCFDAKSKNFRPTAAK